MLQQPSRIQYQLQGLRKKARTRVQVKDIVIRLFKNYSYDSIKVSSLHFTKLSDKKNLSAELQNFT